MAPTTSILALTVACAVMAPSNAFIAPTCTVRTSSMQMAAKPNAAAAAAAAAVVLGGAAMAPFPASAAVQDAANNIAQSASANVDAAKSSISGAASDIADSAKSAVSDSATFQEGADVQRRGAEANISKARDTVSSNVQEAQRGLSQRDVGSGRGGTPSKLNPAGYPTFADGARRAKSGAKDNAGRVGEAVGDAQRGVTQRDGAVDALKDNARASAPFFGKLANDGVNKMANPGGN